MGKSELFTQFVIYLMPVCFLILFMVMLKIMRVMRSQTELIMFYGKQVEDMRKIVAGLQPTPQRNKPVVSDDDMGLYEVLNE
jgi:hypothetical protein